MPIYNTKRRLIETLIPELAAAHPSFPYFSVEAVRQSFEGQPGAANQQTVNRYLHSMKTQGVIFDAGRGWYSTLSEPFVLNRQPVRELVERLEKQFPFLDFSCWSTAQIAAYGHHQLARFFSFVYTERDAVQSVADALRAEGRTAYADPGKEDLEKFAPLADGAILVRPLVTRAPVEGKYASIEKILIDLWAEAQDLNLMDLSEHRQIVANVVSSGRISMAAAIAYATRRNVPEASVNLGKTN